MNLEIAKIAGNIVGSIAGSATVGTIVGTLIPEGLSAVKKAECIVGGVLLGSIAGSACGQYLEEQIDNIGNFVGSMINKDRKEEN